MRGSSRDVGGFTLIEMMIVVAVIAILAAIAIPNLLAARLIANETATIANLRTLWNGEVQLQASAAVDVDSDGAGEYGFLRELSSETGVRLSPDGSTVGREVSPSPISLSFRNLDANGGGRRSGYRFRVSLPSDTGIGVHERTAGAFDGSVSTDYAEVMFTIYAWPDNHNASGKRTFFLNQQGDVLSTDDPSYSGVGYYAAATDGAAFGGSGSVDSITGSPATGTVGRDGNIWVPVK